VDVRQHVVEQERETVMNRTALDGVKVVQDQPDVDGRAGQLVSELGEDLLRRRGVDCSLFHRLELAAGECCRQGGCDVRPEATGVVVGGVQRQPCDCTARMSFQPVGQQRRLPKARRGGQQDQARVGSPVETLAQPVTDNEAAPHSWHEQLRRDRRVCHQSPAPRLPARLG
jgi:hypothetical protein